MKAESLSKHVGNVVVLDLVMGREITTRIKEVDVEGGTVTCSKPRVFVPVPNPHNPQEAQIVTLRYGHPMYTADEELEIDAAHVFTVFIPNADHASAYAKETSGLVQVGAGALGQLDEAAKANGLIT